jgi:hypothetical protein
MNRIEGCDASAKLSCVLRVIPRHAPIEILWRHNLTVSPEQAHSAEQPSLFPRNKAKRYPRFTAWLTVEGGKVPEIGGLTLPGEIETLRLPLPDL